MQTRGFMSTKGYQVPLGSTSMAQLNAAVETGYLGTSLVLSVNKNTWFSLMME
jgi:hypothetical protein